MKRNLKYLCYALVGVIAVVTIIEVVLLVRVFVAGSKVPDHYSIVGKWVPVKEKCYLQYYLNGEYQGLDSLCLMDSIVFKGDGKYHGYPHYPAVNTHLYYNYEQKGDTLWIDSNMFHIERLDDELVLSMPFTDYHEKDTLKTLYHQHFKRM